MSFSMSSLRETLVGACSKANLGPEAGTYGANSRLKAMGCVIASLSQQIGGIVIVEKVENRNKEKERRFSLPSK